MRLNPQILVQIDITKSAPYAPNFSGNSLRYVNSMKYINKTNINARGVKLGADLGVFSKVQEKSGALGALGATEAATRAKARPRYKIRPRPTQIYEYMQEMAGCEKLAAEKLGWSEYFWAKHCLRQDLNKVLHTAQKVSFFI